MLKTSLSAVKRIGQRFVIKGTLTTEVSSDRPRDNKAQPQTVLKGIRKPLLSTAKTNSFSKLEKSRKVKEIGFLSKICGKIVLYGQKSFPSRQSF